jgi:Flp pilus assembly protein TadG
MKHAPDPPTRRRPGAGAISVEMALLFPLLGLLIFSILEMGSTFGDWLLLAEATRATNRGLSTGQTIAGADTIVARYHGVLTSSRLTPTYEHRTWNGYNWGTWQPLTDDGTENVARSGDEVRVTLAYDHPFVSGNLLSSMTGAAERTHVTLRCTISGRRE